MIPVDKGETQDDTGPRCRAVETERLELGTCVREAGPRSPKEGPRLGETIPASVWSVIPEVSEVLDATELCQLLVCATVSEPAIRLPRVVSARLYRGF